MNNKLLFASAILLAILSIHAGEPAASFWKLEFSSSWKTVYEITRLKRPQPRDRAMFFHDVTFMKQQHSDVTLFFTPDDKFYKGRAELHPKDDYQKTADEIIGRYCKTQNCVPDEKGLMTSGSADTCICTNNNIETMISWDGEKKVIALQMTDTILRNKSGVEKTLDPDDFVIPSKSN